MGNYIPKKIFIDENIKNHWLTKQITDYYHSIPNQVVASVVGIEKQIKQSNHPVTDGKKLLFITQNKGSFVKQCPGTNGFICCNYYVIDLIENCHLECSYCFLQSYLTDKMIKIYVNIEDLFSELDHFLTNTNQFYRIGTGELSDSLALDHATNFSYLLMDYFSTKKNALLELKTKTAIIDNVINIKKKKNIVISWSLNPEAVIENNELKTASLKVRLESAFQCQEKGYLLGFHFDPILYYTNWERDYHNVIDQLFNRINPNRIAWISLGGFRFNKSLQPVIEKRFPENNILYQELLESPDGKLRYFIEIREQIYQKMIGMLKAKNQQLLIYLCMEGKYMWKKSFGFVPQNDQNLDKLFYQRLEQIN